MLGTESDTRAGDNQPYGQQHHHGEGFFSGRENHLNLFFILKLISIVPDLLEVLFVGTQDLCVQSNPVFPSDISIQRFHPDGNRFIGPGFVGLDAKILRPYKQMIRSYPQIRVLSYLVSSFLQ
jgi:hypothetical protein